MRATVPMSGPSTPPAVRPQVAVFVRSGTGRKVTRAAVSWAMHCCSPALSRSTAARVPLPIGWSIKAPTSGASVREGAAG